MRHFYTLLFTLIHFFIQGQSILLSGQVNDKDEPLPFATIMVRDSTLGTTTNVNGHFSLKLIPGTFTLDVHYLGYKKKSITLNLSVSQTLQIQMEPEGYKLEVDVQAGEDPSYPILRKAIKKRPDYYKPVDYYSCKSYIKGLQKLGSIPKKLGTMIKLMGGNPSDTGAMKGVIYNSESESRYYFMKPNYEKEIMYSSRVSGNSGGFSFNQLHDMLLLNCNEPLIRMGGISQRPFVSPLNEKAFQYYRFFLLGKSESDNGSISKIKVVPKRKTDPCFSGIIYIQDSTWRLTGVDLTVNKEAKIDFLDTLNIKETYAPVSGDSIWMLVNLNLNFSFNALGFNGKGYFAAAISDYNFANQPEKKFFGNEIFVVEAAANKKDESYWNQARALQLTEEETKDYRKKDSIAVITEKPGYRDSVERADNKFRLGNLLAGYSFSRHKKELRFELPSILTNGVQYNTVEGLNLTYKMSMFKTYARKKSLNVNSLLHYGVANQLVGFEADFIYQFNPIHLGYLGTSVVSNVRQFNNQLPVLPLINSLSTLILNLNPMKLYRLQGSSVLVGYEVVNGFVLQSEIGYFNRQSLSNHSKKLILDNPNIYFTSNTPDHRDLKEGMLVSSDIFQISLRGIIRFKQRYITLPEERIRRGSKWPALVVNYKFGQPINSTNQSFHKLSFSVNDVIRLGMVGRFRFKLHTGLFLFSKPVQFYDYHHFNGNTLPYYHGDYLNGYRMMPYYANSTNSYFIELHGEHHFNGWIFSKIPGLRKLPWQEVIGLHTLTTGEQRLYLETNIGIERIFKILRLDYVYRYEPGKKGVHGLVTGMKLSF